MMRTADPKAPTKEKIIASAIKLMLAQGFTATSVDEIIEDAGATKGSFFHFFESKEDLAKAALDRFVCSQREKFQSASFRKEKDPRKRVLGRINASLAVFKDTSMPKSCLLGNFSQELASTNSEFQSLCGKMFSLASEEFARDLKAAGCREPMSLANMYHSIIQGSLVLAKAKHDVTIAIENLKHFKQYILTQMKRISPVRRIY